MYRSRHKIFLIFYMFCFVINILRHYPVVSNPYHYSLYIVICAHYCLEYSTIQYTRYRVQYSLFSAVLSYIILCGVYLASLVMAWVPACGGVASSHSLCSVLLMSSLPLLSFTCCSQPVGGSPALNAQPVTLILLVQHLRTECWHIVAAVLCSVWTSATI